MRSTAVGTSITRDAPFYKLPAEMLIEILCIGRRQYDMLERGVVTYLTAVSSVCRTWRYAALHEPSLWTTIVYHDYYHFSKISKASEHLPRKIKDRICSYLSRSRNSSLSISLAFGTNGYGLEDIKHIIFPHLFHCRTSTLSFIPMVKHSDFFLCPRICTDLAGYLAG